MKIKVVEALAHGKAIVCTSAAAEGIELRHRVHAWIADTPEAFTEGMLTLRTDDEMREQMEARAKALHAERYSPQSAAMAMKPVFDLSVTHQGGPARPGHGRFE